MRPGGARRHAAWLRRHGYPAPPQDRVGVDIHYATRWFERRPGDLGGLVAAAHGATPDAPFGAVALAQEGDRWVVGLNGYHGRRPPVDLEDFRARARRTDPLIGELVSGRPRSTTAPGSASRPLSGTATTGPAGSPATSS